MPEKDPYRSNVFELSLTEIAFILIFILLLLLGGLYIFQYREAQRWQKEAQSLELQVEDAHKKNISLNEQLKMLRKNANDLYEIRQFLVENKIPIQELKTQLQSALKENSDLKGQLEYVQAKLNGNGLDHPPCWVDEKGKIQYLFTLNLYPKYVKVSPAWTATRKNDAVALPNISRLSGKEMSYNQFLNLSKAIFDVGERKNPQCRYFVRLRSHIQNARESDLARRKIESVFYKLEL